MAHVLCLALLVFAAPSAAAGEPGDSAGDGAHLRGSREPTASLPEAPANATDLANATGLEWISRDAAVDSEGALPGGWGEAADAAASSNFAGEPSTENATLRSTPAGSCAAYGCHTHYFAGVQCQCFAECGGTCCPDFQAQCAGQNITRQKQTIKVLYHQTSPEAGPLILKSGFRPGRAGWCGGGIYFATTPEATETKAIGTDSHKGFIIEATVDIGRVREMPSTCDVKMTGDKLAASSYDSITFNPGDGAEYVVYSARRVLSMRQAPKAAQAVTSSAR